LHQLSGGDLRGDVGIVELYGVSTRLYLGDWCQFLHLVDDDDMRGGFVSFKWSVRKLHHRDLFSVVGRVLLHELPGGDLRCGGGLVELHGLSFGLYLGLGRQRLHDDDMLGGHLRFWHELHELRGGFLLRCYRIGLVLFLRRRQVFK